MTVRALEELGHEVRDIRGTPDEGMPDDDLWSLAQHQRCLLITTDKGFAQHRAARHHWQALLKKRVVCAR